MRAWPTTLYGYAVLPILAVKPVVRLISLSEAHVLQNATDLPGGSDRDRRGLI
jgi:hypothetical protein